MDMRHGQDTDTPFLKNLIRHDTTKTHLFKQLVLKNIYHLYSKKS